MGIELSETSCSLGPRISVPPLGTLHGPPRKEARALIYHTQPGDITRQLPSPHSNPESKETLSPRQLRHRGVDTLLGGGHSWWPAALGLSDPTASDLFRLPSGSQENSSVLGHDDIPQGPWRGIAMRVVAPPLQSPQFHGPDTPHRPPEVEPPPGTHPAPPTVQAAPHRGLSMPEGRFPQPITARGGLKRTLPPAAGCMRPPAHMRGGRVTGGGASGPPQPVPQPGSLMTEIRCLTVLEAGSPSSGCHRAGSPEASPLGM